MYEVKTLPSGLRVAIEPLPHARSVAVGIWLGAGSHYEQPEEAGAAHFLEHMLFKGTSRRSARELADHMDRIGGEFNAVTARETTCYYGWVLTEHWVEALEILTEMLLDSRLDETDVERERNVILEEIRGDEEVGENRALWEFDRLLWGPRHPLGRPVAGTLRSVAALTGDHLRGLRDALYTPDNGLVSVAGAVDPDGALEVVSRVLGRWQGHRRRDLPRAGRPRSGTLARRRRLDQAHLVVGSAGPALGDPQVYPAMVLSTLLGGGASSRLFQRIREDEGLAYTVYAFHDANRLGGSFGLYAAVRPDSAGRALELVQAELQRVVAEEPPEEEVQRARAQIRASVVLGLETVSERMNRMGEGLVLLRRIVSTEEVEARLAAVSPADVHAAARSLFAAGPAVTVRLGPV